MDQRVSLITLGVADVAVSRAFYERLGWTVGLDVEETAGARISREPSETFYGGYAGVFIDPDGHAWEVAYNPGFELRSDGSIRLPKS